MNDANSRTTEIILLLLGLVVLQRAWVWAQQWLETLDPGVYQSEFFTVFFWLQVVALSVSAVLLAFIIYAIIDITNTRRREKEYVERRYKELSKEISPQSINPEWERVKERVESDNPSEWRLAVLDADVILERMVERMQYQGDTLSDKMRNIERSDFNTIDAAWEAHKVRNKIAHEGEDFVITQREARRVIKLYEEVFREFHYI